MALEKLGWREDPRPVAKCGNREKESSGRLVLGDCIEK
jgi:hypothetical protein